MTTRTRSSASIGMDALTWPRAGHDGLTGEADAATALLSAGVEGILGHASEEEWERIQTVLRSTSAFVQTAEVEDALTGGSWCARRESHGFMRAPGLTAADSVGLAIDALWSDADEAVFLFHRGDSLGTTSSLGRALLGLQDSFCPEHVRRVKNEDGIWVIKNIFEDTADSPAHGKAEEKDRTGEAERSSLADLGETTVLAVHLLLSYFVQRVLGLEAEACETREILESTHLREEVS
jgi:hypothetical protein